MNEATYLYNKYMLDPGERWLTNKEYLILAKRLKGEREKKEKNEFLKEQFLVTFEECFSS